jgi:T5SS/PEP-CTERM-associated repeat protein
MSSLLARRLSRCRARCFTIAQLLIACIIAAQCTNSGRAAVTFSGQVSPSSPTSWTSSTTGYIGGSTSSNNGSAIINGASALLSSYGYLGYYTGAVGSAAITGNGSSWTNSKRMYVGYYGSGTLAVTDGGVVSTQTLYASTSAISGNGTITTQGAVLDADIRFDAAHPLQAIVPFGDNGTISLVLCQ